MGEGAGAAEANAEESGGSGSDCSGLDGSVRKSVRGLDRVVDGIFANPLKLPSEDVTLVIQ